MQRKRKTLKEKEGNICRSEKYFCREKARRNIFGEQKIIFWEEKENGEGREEKFGKFSGRLESLWIISGKFPDVWKVARWSGKFLDVLKSVRIIWKIAGWS